MLSSRPSAAGRASRPSAPLAMWAAACGVVTSGLGTGRLSCPSERPTSPVPGGMSITGNRGGPQREELLQPVQRGRATTEPPGPDRHSLELVDDRRGRCVLVGALLDAEHARMCVAVRYSRRRRRPPQPQRASAEGDGQRRGLPRCRSRRCAPRRRWCARRRRGRRATGAPRGACLVRVSEAHGDRAPRLARRRRASAALRARCST